MSLDAPWMLLCLLAMPALVAAYVRMTRARTRRAARLAAEGLVPVGAGATRSRRRSVRRHLPFALFAIAVGLVAFSLARPSATITLPDRSGTLVLAFDVSNSMRAKDLEPTRIEAAKKAASAFVEKQPSSIRIGVVAFGDSALNVLRPSSVKEEVLQAIDRLSVSGGTSLAQGIFVSLSTIAGKPLQIDPEALSSDSAKVDIGYYGSGRIVLLSDGENTGRPEPETVAEVAATAGVQIHAIGLGTEQGTTIDVDGFQLATALDADTLQEIAEATGGSYSEAADAAELAKVYDAIDLKFQRVKKEREITALFAAAGGLLLVIGSALSISWHARVI
jgi:Ca-activated chloride channel family protein